MPAPRDIISDWHRYLNARELDALAELIAPTVEIAGPRGEGTGSPADLRDWVERSGIRLTPVRTWARGDAVVVEQSAHWSGPGNSATEEPTDAQSVFTAFQVDDGRITRLLRFDALAPALAVSGLSARDLVP
jgi:ketosteroid isomerase-like protein